MPRSTRTTDAASVRERAGFAVSAMRTTSPPMLLGRKLLKNVATRNDSVNARARRWTPCASRSSPQRQALATTMRKYSPSATASHGTDADRAYVHNRGTSLRATSSHNSAALTRIFASRMSRRRVGDGETGAGGGADTLNAVTIVVGRVERVPRSAQVVHPAPDPVARWWR